MSSTLIIENPDKFRDNIRGKFSAFFANEKDAINLEKGVHNWTIKEAHTRKVVKKWNNPFFVQLYLDHLRSIYINLKKTNLKDRVLSGEIKSQDIAFMTHQEMCHEKWDEYIRLKSIRDKAKFENRLQASTDIFKCRKCYGRKCSYMQVQTRSADEPMTLFITCLDCGCRWKQ